MIKVWLEVGRRKSFAGAVQWPGWARAGKTTDLALENFVTYGRRYAMVMKKVSKLKVPKSVEDLDVVVELEGNATTDFGAPGVLADFDHEELKGAHLERQMKILRACWVALDSSVSAAEGKSLAKGPRGGGRDAKKMVSHVLGAEFDYLKALGWKIHQKEVRGAFEEALRAKTAGAIPDRGPRGGIRWPARFYVRRSAWHILDHAWEIEDRLP